MDCSSHPIALLGRPEEVAETVVWLCSNKSSFVTGDSLVVGWTIHRHFRGNCSSWLVRAQDLHSDDADVVHEGFLLGILPDIAQHAVEEFLRI